MVRFAVMTDLHTDIIHDAGKRLGEFVASANQAKCDFAIQLGDFIQPEFIGSYICSGDRVSAVMKNILAGKGLQPVEKQALWGKLRKLKCPLYHVLGNHDLDLYTKEEVMAYLGMQSPYYSFDVEGYHFIVLDANYGLEDGEPVSFSRGNYMKWYFQPVEPFPYMPKEQLEWLKQDLEQTDKPTVLFCHEGVNGGFLNLINHDEVFKLLAAAPHGVRLCVCGHKHEDLLEYEADIPVYFVNSMSGYSVTPKFSQHRFSPEIEAKYPNVQYMCVYGDPLYAVITITEDEIKIEGRSSEFVEPGPMDVSIMFPGTNIKLSAKASSFTLK